MTEAYTLGFCKTAEAYGVDPRQLVKAAQASAFINSLKGLGGAVKGLGSALGTTGWLGARTVAHGAGAAARGVSRMGRILGKDFMRGFRPIPRMVPVNPAAPAGSGTAGSDWIKDFLRRTRPAKPNIPTGSASRMQDLASRMTTRATRATRATAPKSTSLNGAFRQSVPPSTATGGTVPGLLGNRVPQTINRPVVPGLP